MQLLLMEVQDRNYSYLTAHIPLLLEEVLCTELRETESLYKDDVGNVRTTTARKRMPWQAYRDCILSGLPEDKGTHDLSAIMTLTRTKGESAISWAQRMNEGKKVVEKKKIELTDAIYADLTLRYLYIEEMKWLIKAYTDAQADASAVGTTATALPWRKSLREIESMKWKGLRELIKGMNVQTFKPYQPGWHKHLADTRLFTLAQAATYVRMFKPKSASTKGKTNKTSKSKKQKVSCHKCIDAGLTGRCTWHRPEDCKPEFRHKKFQKLNDRKKRQQSESGDKAKQNKYKRKWNEKNSNNENRKNTKSDKKECSTCKQAGRKYFHDPARCFYAPGGK
jgi:hypothetical protein